MSAISEELIEKMVRGRGAGRRSPEESLKLLVQLRRAFPQLGMAEVPKFLKVGENICYEEGSLLTKQGEENEYLWLLLSGTLNVIVNSQVVAQLSEGALIGEAGLFGGPSNTRNLERSFLCKHECGMISFLSSFRPCMPLHVLLHKSCGRFSSGSTYSVEQALC